MQLGGQLCAMRNVVRGGGEFLAGQRADFLGGCCSDSHLKDDDYT